MPRASDTPFVPTPADLQAAASRTLVDVIAPHLKVLFCGINPGLYSAAIGHHFGRPGNRFWPALFAGGFTPRLFSPFEDEKLLELGFGITNFVRRASASAADLSDEEINDGAAQLQKRLRRYQPQWLAICGIGAYRVGFSQPKARVGPQSQAIEGCRVWVLPSPSGLNAHHQPRQHAEMFRALREAVG